MCWLYASFVIWVVFIWPKFIERNSILFNKEHKFFHISQNNFCPRILVKFFFCSTLTHLWTDLFMSSTSGRCTVYMKCWLIKKVIDGLKKLTFRIYQNYYFCAFEYIFLFLTKNSSIKCSILPVTLFINKNNVINSNKINIWL